MRDGFSLVPQEMTMTEGQGDDEEAQDEEEVADEDGVPMRCRICYGSGRRSSFVSPCRCSGSIKYVHRSCLNQWRASGLNPNNLIRCDMCHTKYRMKRKPGSLPRDIHQEVRKLYFTLILRLLKLSVVFAASVLILGYIAELFFPTMFDPERPQIPIIMSSNTSPFDVVGNGYCRDPSGKNPWNTSASCDTLEDCKERCKFGDCAGFAWSERPYNYDDGCRREGLPRCTVYMGTDQVAKKTTWWQAKEYTCFRPLPPLNVSANFSLVDENMTNITNVSFLASADSITTTTKSLVTVLVNTSWVQINLTKGPASSSRAMASSHATDNWPPERFTRWRILYEGSTIFFSLVGAWSLLDILVAAWRSHRHQRGNLEDLDPDTNILVDPWYRPRTVWGVCCSSSCRTCAELDCRPTYYGTCSECDGCCNCSECNCESCCQGELCARVLCFVGVLFAIAFLFTNVAYILQRVSHKKKRDLAADFEVANYYDVDVDQSDVVDADDTGASEVHLLL